MIGLLSITGTGCSFYPAITPVAHKQQSNVDNIAKQNVEESIKHIHLDLDGLKSGLDKHEGQPNKSEANEQFVVDFKNQPIIDITKELEKETDNTDQDGPGEDPVTEIVEEQKVIALTFDDGPDLKYTPQVLDILLEKNIKATFFIVGVQINKYPEVVLRMVEEGHLIANHTYYHPNLTTLNKAELLKELDDTDDLIESIVGFKPQIVRPPYGAINKEVRQRIEETGRSIVMWNIDPRDWASTPVKEMYENVMTNARDKGNILFHSFGGKQIQNTVDLLPDVIDSLTEEGYTFVTVDQYLDNDE